MYDIRGKRITITGGVGFVGMRLVEMCLDEGAEVTVLDVKKPEDETIKFFQGSIANFDLVKEAVKAADVCYHVCAVVGPFHPDHVYHEVNVLGTRNVLRACELQKVKKLICVSSPCTRMNGSDIRREVYSEMEFPLKNYVWMYAKTKAQSELEILEAAKNSTCLITVLSPHQVYGPRDNLFIPNYIKNAKRMRIFGDGQNEISVTYVDNFCHSLLLAEKHLHDESSELRGKTLVVTDGPPVLAYDFLGQILLEVTGHDLHSRLKIPRFLIIVIALLNEIYCYFKKTTPSLTRYTARMLFINRSFDISETRRILDYKPLYTTDEALKRTLPYFKT